MDTNRKTDLARMYSLLARVDGLDSLRTAFKDYIRVWDCYIGIFISVCCMKYVCFFKYLSLCV